MIQDILHGLFLFLYWLSLYFLYLVVTVWQFPAKALLDSETPCYYEKGNKVSALFYGLILSIVVGYSFLGD